MYIDLLKEIDFSKELEEAPELKSFMKDAGKFIANEQAEILAKFKKPKFDENLENHLIVTNIPELTPEKEDKFKLYFEKNILEKKAIGKTGGLESYEIGHRMVEGKKVYNKTVYMIYKTAANAKKAYQKLHKFKFDGKTTFACYTAKEFHAVEKISDKYTKPRILSKKEEIEFNFEQNLRDQFIVRAQQLEGGGKVYLNWFDALGKEVKDALDDQPIRISDNTSNVIFSHRGNYAAICEPDGVRIFGGKILSEKAFFPHKGVIDVVFSPNESFLISFNGNDSYVKNQENLILWGLQEEIKLQSFKAEPHQDLQSFQFTRDESRLAIVGSNEIFLYESSSVEELKGSLKQSEDELIAAGHLLKAINIQKIKWHHDNTNLVCVCYELNPAVNSNSSSKIYFVNSETKEEKKWKAIGQHIKKVEIMIEDNGKWVAVYFKKISKKNQHASSVYITSGENLVKRRGDAETDVIDVKSNIVSVSWDKRNSRFGLVYEIPAVRNDRIQYGVLFYQISISQNTTSVANIGQIHETPSNRLILAENGVYFALYNVSLESAGRFKFSLGYFASEGKSKKISIEFVKQNVEVSYMKFFEMDPSGRYVILGTDKAYYIWSMTGELIMKDIFIYPIFNVHFRPRYIVHLTKEEEDNLRKREKEIKEKFKEEDKKRMNFLAYEKEKEKQAQRLRFKELMESKKQWFAQFKEKRDQMRGFREDDPKIKSARFEFLDRDN